MKKNKLPQITVALAAVCLASNISSALAQTVLFSDNFNVADTGTYDGATTPSGSLAGTVAALSRGNENSIVSGQLFMNNAFGHPAGLRFQAVGNPSYPANIWNWASGSSGSQILAAGGMTVSFLWTSPNNTSGAWLSYAVGITPSGGNPDLDYSVLNGDSGILLQNNGVTQVFANGAGGLANSFDVTSLTHQVSLTYTFSSFADGSPVSLAASVDGNLIDTQSFSWNGNGGAQYMDIQTSATATIDNFTISTIAPVPEPSTLVLAFAGLGGLFWLRRKTAFEK